MTRQHSRLAGVLASAGFRRQPPPPSPDESCDSDESTEVVAVVGDDLNRIASSVCTALNCCRPSNLVADFHSEDGRNDRGAICCFGCVTDDGQSAECDAKAAAHPEFSNHDASSDEERERLGERGNGRRCIRPSSEVSAGSVGPVNAETAAHGGAPPTTRKEYDRSTPDPTPTPTPTLSPTPKPTPTQPPCAETSSTALTTPGAPKVCRMGCGRTARYQPGSRDSLDLCCGLCFQTHANEHADNCGVNPDLVPIDVPDVLDSGGDSLSSLGGDPLSSLTRPGPPKLCRNIARCGRAAMFQTGPFDYCCGRCFDTYAEEHSDMCSTGRDDVGDSVSCSSASGRAPVPTSVHCVLDSGDGPPTLTAASDSESGGEVLDRSSSFRFGTPHQRPRTSPSQSHRHSGMMPGDEAATGDKLSFAERQLALQIAQLNAAERAAAAQEENARMLKEVAEQTKSSAEAQLANAEATAEATRSQSVVTEAANAARLRTSASAETDQHVFMRMLAADAQMGDARLASSKFGTTKYFMALKAEFANPLRAYEQHKARFQVTNFHLRALARVELGGTDGLSPDHCKMLTSLQIEDLPHLRKAATLPPALADSERTDVVPEYAAQGAAFGALLSMVYCKELGDKYAAMVAHLTYLATHSAEDWSLFDVREALSRLGEEFVKRISDGVEDAKTEVAAATDTGGSGVLPTPAQMLEFSLAPDPDTDVSRFISAHEVYDLDSNGFFEQTVVGDMSKRRNRRTRRLARDNDEKARRAEIAEQAQRGRVRGAGRTPVVAEPVVDEAEAAPAATSASISSPTPDQTAAIVAAAMAKAVTARRRGSGSLRRAERKAEKSVKFANTEGNEADTELDPAEKLDKRAGVLFLRLHEDLHSPSLARAAGVKPYMERDEMSDARTHIPADETGKQMCVKFQTHDDCDRDEDCHYAHMPPPPRLATAAMIAKLPLSVQIMGVAYGGFKKSSATPIPRTARENAIKLLRAKMTSTCGSGWCAPPPVYDVVRDGNNPLEGPLKQLVEGGASSALDARTPPPARRQPARAANEFSVMTQRVGDCLAEQLSDAPAFFKARVCARVARKANFAHSAAMLSARRSIHS